MTDDADTASDAPAEPEVVRSPLATRHPTGTFEPRHVPDATTVTFTSVHDPDHPLVELRARTLPDAEPAYWYIDPHTAEEAAVLESFGYPVAAKVVEARAAEAKRAERAAAREAAKAEKEKS